MQVFWLERCELAAGGRYRRRTCRLESPLTRDDDTRRVDLGRPRRPASALTTCTGVDERRARSMPVPTNGASARSSGTAWRCMFAAHEGAVGVVVLEERDERGRHRHHLASARRPCSSISSRGNEHRPRRAVDGHGRRALRRSGRPCRAAALAWAMMYFASSIGRQVDRPRRSRWPSTTRRYGRLDEAVLVDAREGRQRVDQTDVRAFRRFDRAHAAVVRSGERRGLRSRRARGSDRPGQAPTGGACGSDSDERVVLVHELRQLRGAEELLDRRQPPGLRVDQVLRRDRRRCRCDGHALA